jgi:hypothetical protein
MSVSRGYVLANRPNDTLRPSASHAAAAAAVYIARLNNDPSIAIQIFEDEQLFDPDQHSERVIRTFIEYAFRTYYRAGLWGRSLTLEFYGDFGRFAPEHWELASRSQCAEVQRFLRDRGSSVVLPSIDTSVDDAVDDVDASTACPSAYVSTGVPIDSAAHRQMPRHSQNAAVSSTAFPAGQDAYVNAAVPSGFNSGASQSAPISPSVGPTVGPNIDAVVDTSVGTPVGVPVDVSVGAPVNISAAAPVALPSVGASVSAPVALPSVGTPAGASAGALDPRLSPAAAARSPLALWTPFSTLERLLCGSCQGNVGLRAPLLIRVDSTGVG